MPLSHGEFLRMLGWPALGLLAKMPGGCCHYSDYTLQKLWKDGRGQCPCGAEILRDVFPTEVLAGFGGNPMVWTWWNFGIFVKWWHRSNQTFHGWALVLSLRLWPFCILLFVSAVVSGGGPWEFPVGCCLIRPSWRSCCLLRRGKGWRPSRLPWRRRSRCLRPPSRCRTGAARNRPLEAAASAWMTVLKLRGVKRIILMAEAMCASDMDSRIWQILMILAARNPRFAASMFVRTCQIAAHIAHAISGLCDTVNKYKTPVSHFCRECPFVSGKCTKHCKLIVPPCLPWLRRADGGDPAGGRDPSKGDDENGKPGFYASFADGNQFVCKGTGEMTEEPSRNAVARAHCLELADNEDIKAGMFWNNLPPTLDGFGF